MAGLNGRTIFHGVEGSGFPHGALGARSKTAYRESGTNRFNPIPITGKGREIRFSPAISRSFVVVSSIWLQLIWMTVGSTVKTRDLVKLNNNSIPTAPTT